MADDFPSNSNTSKEAQKKPPVSNTGKEPKKIVQITEGSVTQRKKSRTKRAKALFFGGDARGAVMFVATEVLVPALKDMIIDGGREVLERIVLGDRRSQSSYRGNYYSRSSPTRTRYDGYSRPTQYAQTAPWRREEPRHVSDHSRAVFDFGEIIIESRGEAEQVLDTLIDVIQQYGQTSVSDLYGLVGITSAYTDQKYGWTTLQGSTVQHVRGGGYLLVLPRPVPLD